MKYVGGKNKTKKEIISIVTLFYTLVKSLIYSAKIYKKTKFYIYIYIYIY